MFNKLFEKKETPTATAENPTRAPEKVFGPTKKKKITYVIEHSPFYDPTVWQFCAKTQLCAAQINGKLTSINTGWKTLTPFPNPGAYDMAAQREDLFKIMGEKMATTIIEYMDKETNKPVVTVFPTYVHIHDGYEDNYQERLNHMSRKDLNYQIMMRRRALENADQR